MACLRAAYHNTVIKSKTSDSKQFNKHNSGLRAGESVFDHSTGTYLTQVKRQKATSKKMPSSTNANAKVATSVIPTSQSATNFRLQFTSNG
jgi:hypothetical protein